MPATDELIRTTCPPLLLRRLRCPRGAERGTEPELFEPDAEIRGVALSPEGRWPKRE